MSVSEAEAVAFVFNSFHHRADLGFSHAVEYLLNDNHRNGLQVIVFAVYRAGETFPCNLYRLSYDATNNYRF